MAVPNEKSDKVYEYEWGWNDPPQLNYQSQSMGTGKKPLYMQQKTLYPSPAGHASSQQEQVRSSGQLAAPPVENYLGKKPSAVVENGTENNELSSETEEKIPDLSVVITALEKALEDCSTDLNGKTREDIKRRLGIFSKQWGDGCLSPTVKNKIHQLSKALMDKKFDEAHQLHLSLVMDHVGEVSQWMVGVKKIIATCQKHTQE